MKFIDYQTYENNILNGFWEEDGCYTVKVLPNDKGSHLNNLMLTIKNNKLNSIDDKPSLVNLDLNRFVWHKNGLLHRDNDLPAVIENEGREWYQNDLLHRDNDLPAIEKTNGDKEWYQNGLFHRDNDLPAIISSNKGFTIEEWYQNGKCHRNNGYAMIDTEFKENEYYICGINISKKTFNNLPRNSKGEIHYEKELVIYSKNKDRHSVFILNGKFYEKEKFEEIILEQTISKTKKKTNLKV